MIWRKISVKTKEEAVEILAAYLFDRWEIEGVEIEDGKGRTEEEAKQIFADILPEENESQAYPSISKFYRKKRKKREGLW